jgi:L-iditol 2-dehydrogenase
MKALVKYAKGNGNLEIRDVPIPEPGPGQVKIEVKVAGICGSDLHIYHDDIAIPVNPPVVLGHEFSGVVAAVGEGVTTCKPGDRVVSETAYSYCTECALCKSGFYNLCNQRKTLGYWYNGVFAKYTLVPQERIHILPEEIDFVAGAMLEPLACVTHAFFDLANVESTDVVLVSGPGPIGIMTALVAKSQGAYVILSGTTIDKDRLKLAKSLGVDYTVNIEKQDLSSLVDEVTAGVGVDAVFECSGSDAATNAGLRLCKKRGYFVQVGLGGKPIMFDIESVCFREIQLSGSLGSRFASWDKAIKLAASGKVNLLPLASHTMPITEWQGAFELFEKKLCNKVILTPVD